MRKAFDCRNEKYACLKSFQTGIIVNNRAVFLRLRYNVAASHQCVAYDAAGRLSLRCAFIDSA